jgi:hypothetical protein
MNEQKSEVAQLLQQISLPVLCCLGKHHILAHTLGAHDT